MSLVDALNPEFARGHYEYDLVQPGDDLPNLENARVLAIDLETTTNRNPDKKSGLNPWKSKIGGLAIAAPGKAWYMPLRHSAPGSQNLDPATVMEWLRGTLKERDRVIINHNLGFDLKFLAQEDVRVPFSNDHWCTLIGSMLVDETLPFHGLKPLADKYLKMPAVEEAALKAYLKDEKTMDYGVVPIDIMAPYACGDVERALRLAAHQKGAMDREEMWRVFDVERKLTPLLVDMSLRGIRVDVMRLKLEKIKYLETCIQLEQEIEKLAGASINSSSSGELADLFVNHLGLPILARTPPSKKSPYGEPSFTDDVLIEYMTAYPQLAQLFWRIRKVRRLYHLLQSFIDPYLYWQVDGIIHGNFNAAGTETGRLSANDPNLQQVANQEKWIGPDGEVWLAPGARQFFIPDPGMALLSCDYEQVEYRLFAHYTNAPRLLTAYNDNRDMDFHQWCADVILGGRLGKDGRKPAKSINFGIIYGMGERKLIKAMRGNSTTLDDAEARSILHQYYREVPELKPLQKHVGSTLVERGYVKTLFGRRRRVDPNWRVKKKDDGLQVMGLLPYQALNALCQGSAADICKDRMNAVGQTHGVLKDHSNATLRMTVHDELVFQVPADAVHEYADMLIPVMEDVKGVRVPLYVKPEMSHERWSEKVPAGTKRAEKAE